MPAASHSRTTRPSSAAEASNHPPGEKARQVIELRWPVKVLQEAGKSRFQTDTVESALPQARRRISGGENVTQEI